MKNAFFLLAKAASSEANVLIAGESGTGKELFARAIHQNSPRKDAAFVVVDCAALPETLVESTLFGHEKGSFTGAVAARDGLVREADGGTLFLDEVGEIPLQIQKSFLRVLQEHRFRPVGGRRELTSRFRLIAATNRNLDTMAVMGTFRSDLLYRLRTIVLPLPPLRRREGDIHDLVLHYTQVFCDRYDVEMKGFSPEFLHAVVQYDWPGNVRELYNAVEHAISIAREEPTLFPVHLPVHIRARIARQSVDRVANAPRPRRRPAPGAQESRTLKRTLEEVERQYLQSVLSMTGNDVKRVCEVAGLSRAQVYRLLKKHDLR